MNDLITLGIFMLIACLIVLGYWIYKEIDYRRYCKKLHREFLARRTEREKYTSELLKSSEIILKRYEGGSVKK